VTKYLRSKEIQDRPMLDQMDKSRIEGIRYGPEQYQIVSRQVPGMFWGACKEAGYIVLTWGRRGDDVETTYGTQKDFILYRPHRDFVGTM
jgi:hypothetical protein